MSRLTLIATAAAGIVLGLAGGGCSADAEAVAQPRDNTSPPPTNVQLQPAMDPELSAVGPGATETTAGSCTEFVPLGIVPDGASWMARAIDPHSSYLFWSLGSGPGGTQTSLYRWSAEQGVTAIGTFTDLYLAQVGSGGSALVGSRFGVEGKPIDGFRWTLADGIVPLDFIPFRLNDDGSLIVGASAEGLVRWSEGAGSRVIDPEPSLSAMGSLSVATAADVIAGSVIAGRAFRWTAANGSKDLGVLDAEVGEPFVRHISANGTVIAGGVFTSAQQIRCFRWTEERGMQELGLPPATAAGASCVPEHMTSDGSVIVGEVRFLEPYLAYPFRWTEATGMQDLSPERQTAYATYVSSSGHVVIGDFGDPLHGFRWTEGEGLQAIERPASLGIAADGDLLVGNAAQGPFVRTFGRQAGSTPALMRLAPAGLVPEGWSRARVDGIANDGRLIFGDAFNPNGEREGWLLRLRGQCGEP